MNFKLLIFLSIVLFSCGENDNSEYEKYLEEENIFNLQIIKNRSKDIFLNIEERSLNAKNKKVAEDITNLIKFTNVFIKELTSHISNSYTITYKNSLIKYKN